MDSRSSDCESRNSKKSENLITINRDNVGVAPKKTSHVERQSSAMVAKPSMSSKSSSKGKSPSQGSKERDNASARSAHCYKKSGSIVRAKCDDTFIWQNGKYQRDECGSGIIPPTFNFRQNRATWCQVPLSMYQATIGELGRQILCRLTSVPRDVKAAPPCNIDEYILPPCRGYYRKYECIKPCEEEHASVLKGQRVYRDAVTRYWQPCLEGKEKETLNVNDYAHHNVTLGKKMRRVQGTAELPCW